jgi:hypothetical protein
MSEAGQRAQFTDGEGYEKFMGQWESRCSRVFLDWLSAPSGLKWLEVGRQLIPAANTFTVHVAS